MAKRFPASWVAALLLAAPVGAQTPGGPAFQVSTSTVYRKFRNTSAMAPGGDFVVAWSAYPGVGHGERIVAQRLTASGLRRGGEFQVNTYTTGYQTYPEVAMGPAGDFVVVWESAPGEDGSAFGISGRRFDAAGAPLGADFVINTRTTVSGDLPRVGRAADGRLVVVWQSGYADTAEIAGRRFAATGDPIGDEFVVNASTTGRQLFPDLAVAADGSFVVAWTDLDGRDGSLDGIFGIRYDADGSRLGGDFQVNTSTIGRQTGPVIDRSSDGGFVVAWGYYDFSDFSKGVAARRFDKAGNGLGDDFVVFTATDGHRQYFGRNGLTEDALGNFVMAWADRDPGPPTGFYRVFGQRYLASGTPREGLFTVNAQLTGTFSAPALVSDPVGNFVVTWESAPNGPWQVYAQRYGGLAASALSVDDSGNRVLEPGETNVSVRPSWRNFNGAAQAFGGTLGAFTGPGGATYTILDPTGTYGTVPDGVTAVCTDCYAVSLTNPTPRPALHWDASVVESIVPDAQGQQKRWLLHVGGSFDDVLVTSPYYPFVEKLLHTGVTVGCGGGKYCPGSSTTREQMAVFVLVAREGAGYLPPACTAEVFGDVPASSPFCRWIVELARRSVVAGCGGGNYCPQAPVSREQMAVFTLRTLDPALAPPACGTPLFADVPATSPYCRWIEELARRGVVSGCGGGNYCPAANVSREQMAVFIAATFGLNLYGP